MSIPNPSGGGSFLERMKARMAGGQTGPLFQAQRPKEKSRHVIVTNRWDERVWKKARGNDKIENLITDLQVGDEHKGGERKPYDPGDALVKDLFMALYRANPEVENKKNLEREVILNRKIIEELLENPKLRELQEITASDAAMSTVALDAMADNVREILVRVPPPPPPPSPGGGKPGEGGGEGEGQAPGGPGDDEDNLDGDQEFDPQQEIDDAEAEWEKAFDDLMDEEGVDLERMLNKALDEAQDDAGELDDMRRGIGLDDGTWQTMSPEERLKMAERLRSQHMKDLAEIIGRMKRFALGIKATRIVNVPHEAYDVETGDDLKRMLRSELVYLSTPETKYEFFRKFVEKELLQFKMRGKEEIGKGPIVIAIDKSGSMSGQPFNWAMAVAEALRRFAADEDRDYYAMFFGSNHDRERFDFPEGKGPFEKVLAFLSCVANGGTEFDGVLTEALQRASKAHDESGQSKADIVFITDGEAHLSEEWIKKFNEERERVGVRVYSIYIGGGYDMRYSEGPINLLNRLSDVVIPVKDLTPEAAKAVFERV